MARTACIFVPPTSSGRLCLPRSRRDARPSSRHRWRTHRRRRRATGTSTVYIEKAANPAAEAASATVGRTNVRWIPILALVAVGTAINYLDRTVLGIAAPHLSKDLGLTPTEMGLVFSAFSWSYAALQIPGGIFLDRFGTRFTYFISIGLWSFFT